MSNKNSQYREKKKKQILQQFEEYIDKNKVPETTEKSKPAEQKKEVELQEKNIKLQDLIVKPKNNVEKVETIKKEIKEELLEEEKPIEAEPYDLEEPEISKTMFDLDLDTYLERNKIVEEQEDVDLEFWKEEAEDDTARKIHILQPILASFGVLVLITVVVGALSSTNLKELAMSSKEEAARVETTEHNVRLSKQVEWTAKNELLLQLNVTSDIDYNNKGKDIVLMIDTSTAMNNDLTKVVDELKQYTSSILAKNNNTQISIITFNKEAKVVQTFTKDQKNLENALNSITLSEGRNYNEALKRLNQSLITYTKNDNELVALLVTNGIPSEGMNSAKGSYEIVKDNHPGLQIKGIQYNIGNEVLSDLEISTDDQWISNYDTLKDTLIEATLDPEKINLELEEEITKFFSIKNLSSNKGIATRDNNKIYWNISKNKFATGSTATLDVELELKPEFQYKMNQYEVSEKTVWKSEGETKELDVSPSVKNYYTVKYEANAPTGCRVVAPKQRDYYVFDVVKIDQEPKNCKGFQFRGWGLATNQKTYGKESFVMPASDVTLRGVWSTFEITSSR